MLTLVTAGIYLRLLLIERLPGSEYDAADLETLLVSLSNDMVATHSQPVREYTETSRSLDAERLCLRW